MPMRPPDLILRGYAERDSDGSWFAICIDLNLYARAATCEAVIEELHSVIRTYVTAAVTVDHEHAGDLLSRSAPAYFHVRYWFIRLLCALAPDTRGKPKDGKFSFKDALPL